MSGSRNSHTLSAGRSALRRRVARMITRLARVVLVNDDRTADEVRDVAGVESRKVPYLAAAGPW